MKNVFDTLITVIPFLSPYPGWVKGVVGFWILFTAIMLVILLYTRPQEKQAQTLVAKSNVNLKNSPGAIVQNAVDSPGSIQVVGDLTTNITTQIPLPLKFETSIDRLRTFNRKMFDVLYILPNKEVAFIKTVEEGVKYILFYTNEDVSEIHVPEKYRADPDITDEACWIVTLVKTENGYDTHLVRGPKSYRVPPGSVYERY